MACWPRLPLADAVSRWLVGRLREREAAAGRCRQPLAGWQTERKRGCRWQMPSAAGWLAERERISESKIEFPATEKKVPSHGIPVVQGKIVICTK